MAGCLLGNARTGDGFQALLPGPLPSVDVSPRHEFFLFEDPHSVYGFQEREAANIIALKIREEESRNVRTL